METQMSQRENASRVPDGKPGMSGRPSLGEILQSRREGVLGWPAPLQWDGGKDGRASLPGVVQALGWRPGESGKGKLPAGRKTDDGVLGKKACQYKAGEGCSVVQMKGRVLELGFHVKSFEAVKGLDDTDYVYWPANLKGGAWSGEPCVGLAMSWGGTASEGTSGWSERHYLRDDFLDIVQKINVAFGELQSFKPLCNEENKTLIAIRAFRSGDGAMAEQTLNDLKEVLRIVEKAGWDLYWWDLIGFWDTLKSIEAELGEAHPGTLPTARVVFRTKTLYFKGRGGAVEWALVGAGDSVAKRISEHGSGRHATGTHRLVDGDDQIHFAEEVKKGDLEDMPMDAESVVRAWVSAIKTAVLACVTGSGDMHVFNFVKEPSGAMHLIDGEFLLDVSEWKNYEDSIRAGSFYNIKGILVLAEPHLFYLAGKLSPGQWEGARKRILEEFGRMDLGQEGVLDHVLEPVEALIENRAFLRTMPQGTGFWLDNLTAYNNEPGGYSFEKDWAGIESGFEDCIDLDTGEKEGVCAELRDNYGKGMVPLFHVEASSGSLYLNKKLIIGHVKEGRTVAKFLEFLKNSFAKAVNEGKIAELIEDRLNSVRPKGDAK